MSEISSDNRNYVVSARKYRPATFRSVVGQKVLTTTLKSAIDSNRLAQAYLFCGPRGVGKTSCARIFARTINCMNPDADGEACGECESCRAIANGTSYNVVELDAASNNSVDDIRALNDQVRVPPQAGRYRVFIIDEVHMLTQAAFNAFLKTLEEPPANVIFILATTEKHKVIPTIMSRCQVYDFKRITVDDMVEHLQWVAQNEGVTTEVSALDVIARKADGAMRDALSIFDQVAASTEGNVTYERTIATLNVLDYEYYFRLVDAFVNGDVASALLIYKEVRDGGFDSLFFIDGLAEHIRTLMVAANAQTLPLIETAADTAARYGAQASKLPLQWYYAALRILSDADVAYRTSANKRLLVEVTLIRLCQLLTPAQPPFDRADDKIKLQNPLGNTAVQPVAQSQPEKAAPVAKAASATVTVETARPKVVTPSLSSAQRQPSTAKGERPRTTRISDVSQFDAHSMLSERTEAFSDDQFRECWDRFIAMHPSQVILVSAMREASPERTGAESFRIRVAHPAAYQAFETTMPELLRYFRDNLRNDRLTINVEIDEDVKIEKRLSPTELLKEMLENNPALGEFLSDIDGEIS